MPKRPTISHRRVSVLPSEPADSRFSVKVGQPPGAIVNDCQSHARSHKLDAGFVTDNQMPFFCEGR